MLAKVLISWVLLLATVGLLLAHPLSQSPGMSYTGSEEDEEQLGSPVDLPFSEHDYLSQGTAALTYPSFLTGGTNNRDSPKTAAFLPSQVIKEILLEKPLLNPIHHFLGNRKQFRKRGGNTECFWKYCV